MGQLAAAIAHEIRNPLASISGSVEMLKMFIDAGEDEERLMNIVIREIDRLNGLISEFLEYTRSRRRSRISVSLYDIIEETVEMFRMDRAMLGEIEVHLDIEACKGCDILADVEGVRQVFWNLLRNAAEAMEGVGLIQVEVLAGDMTPGEPLSLLRSDADSPKSSEVSGFRILVSDDGPGIRPEHQARIFEPFFSTKQEGTGLGLATIYRIVEDHDGLIQVDSSEKGTTFRIDLPLSQQPIGAMLASKQAFGMMGMTSGVHHQGSQSLDVSSEEAQALFK